MSVNRRNEGDNDFQNIVQSKNSASRRRNDAAKGEKHDGKVDC
jgi:hypothetical protein